MSTTAVRDIELLVHTGLEDTARGRYGEALIDAWFREVEGEDPHAARCECEHPETCELRDRSLKVYLLIHGEVETAPGRFEPGVVSSSGHPDRAAAEAEWERVTALGLYEEPFERPEYKIEAPTLATLLGATP
jgi:hypothetical protein